MKSGQDWGQGPTTIVRLYICEPSFTASHYIAPYLCLVWFFPTTFACPCAHIVFYSWLDSTRRLSAHHARITLRVRFCVLRTLPALFLCSAHFCCILPFTVLRTPHLGSFHFRSFCIFVISSFPLFTVTFVVRWLLLDDLVCRAARLHGYCHLRSPDVRLLRLVALIRSRH